MDWQFDDGRAIYTQLIEQIERAVVTGVFPPGGKIPGVRELAADAGVNPNTMQRALAELEARGLLYSERTAGRFVTTNESKISGMKDALAAKLAEQFVSGMQALGCSDGEIDRYVKEATK